MASAAESEVLFCYCVGYFELYVDLQPLLKTQTTCTNLKKQQVIVQ